jgi:hypothetical protein
VISEGRCSEQVALVERICKLGWYYRQLEAFVRYDSVLSAPFVPC